MGEESFYKYGGSMCESSMGRDSLFLSPVMDDGWLQRERKLGNGREGDVGGVPSARYPVSRD